MKLLTENLGWKIFSLVVSVFLWISFAQDPEIGAFVSVPVEFKGMPDDLEVGSDVVEAVSVEVRGAGEIVRKFHAAPTAVSLDFSSIHSPGEQTFHLDDRNVRLPSGLRLLRVVPARIRFEFERRLSRELPVQVRFAGSPEAGYRVSRHQVRPETLTVEGPASRVKLVEFAVTDPVDLSHVVAETEFHVNAFISDPHVRLTNPNKVSIRVFVEKK